MRIVEAEKIAVADSSAMLELNPVRRVRSNVTLDCIQPLAKLMNHLIK